MRFVAIKSVQQQAVLHLHHSRRMLLEFGGVIAIGASMLRKRLPEVLEDAGNELSPMARGLVAELQDRLSLLDERIVGLERRLQQWHSNDEASRRLARDTWLA